MKKTVLLMMALLLGTAGVSAQDTLVSSTPKYTYYYNNWIDSHSLGAMNYPLWQTGKLVGKYFFTKDSLTVYGVAISLYPYSSAYMGYQFLEDTTMDRCYEYVGLL